MEIKIINGYYWLYDGGEPVIKSEFVKVNKLKDNSNYYCLWPNDKCFYLYHHINRRYIGGDSKYTFNEIRHYSEITHSFAAFRSDKEWAHLIFEDGFMAPDTFLEIGEESDDEYRSRPVKYTYKEERWCFYNTTKRNFAWPKDKGYELSSDWSLAKRYRHSYYSLYHREGFYELAFYDENRNGDNKYYFFDAYENPNYQFSSISPYGKYLVCKSKTNLYFVFDTQNRDSREKERYPLCSSIGEPILENGCIIISNGENWQIYYERRIVENYLWGVDKKIMIRGQYVFCQNGYDDTWRIYSVDTGWEVFTDWNNIHIDICDKDDIRLFVDTPTVLQLERRIEHIAKASEDWLKKIVEYSQIGECSQITHKTSLQDIVSTNTKTEECIATPVEKKLTVQENVIPDSNIECGLPDHIDYIIALDIVRVWGDPPSNIINDRKDNLLTKGDVIYWYDKSSDVIHISQYKGHKKYKILFTHKLVKPLEYLDFIPQKFTSMRLDGISISNIEEKIVSYWSKEETEKQDFRLQKVNAFLIKLGFESEQIAKAIEVLAPDSVKAEPLIEDEKYVSFTYKDKQQEKDYKLKPNDIWPIDFPFNRQKFLNKSDYIAVLIGDNFNDSSYNEYADYEMIGQGKDKSFSQEFEHTPINKAIRDCSKRVLLFKNVDGFLTFYDEVESIGYDLIPEDENDNQSRLLIKFYLRSLIRNKK